MTNRKLLPLYLSAFTAAMTQAHLSHAGAPSDGMEEVVVRASTLERSLSHNPRPVAVLNGAALQQRSQSTLGETLQLTAGVNSASFGPSVGTPVIRGQSANRVQVMQDNLSTLDASNSSGDHANAVEPMLAEQIEVLRGPQTLRFGSGAIGGVVNIIDNRIPLAPADETSGALETRHATANDETTTVMRLDGGQGRFAWHLDGLYRDSNDVEIPGSADAHGGDETSHGFIANSDAMTRSGTVGGNWFGEQGSIGLSVNYLENRYGIPPGGHEHEEEEEHHGGAEDHDEHAGHDHDVRIQLRQIRYDLKGELLNPSESIEKLRLRVGYVDYEHTEFEGPHIGSQFYSDAYEGRLEALHTPFNEWQGVIGLHLLDRDFGTSGEEGFIPPSKIRASGLYAVEERQFGDWLIEAGARLDTQTIDPEGDRQQRHNTYSLSLSGEYLLAENQHLQLSLTRAQRAPSVEELFSNGPHLASQSYDLGNPELDEETSLNWEINYRYEGAITLQANLFYNDIDQFIYKANSGEEDHDHELVIYQYRQQDARFRGAELELDIPLNEAWSLRLFGDTVRATLQQGGHLPRITPDRVGATLSFEQGIWSAGTTLLRASSQHHPGALEEETDRYTRVDAHLNVDLEPVTLFVRLHNAFDAEIRNASSYLRDVAPEAGRSITAGVRYQF